MMMKLAVARQLSEVERSEERATLATVRELLNDWNRAARSRSELSEGDVSDLGRIANAAEEFRETIRHEKGFRAMLPSLWDEVLENLKRYEELTLDSKIISLSSGREIPVPAIGDQPVRERIYQQGVGLLKAIDNFESAVKESSARQKEDERQQVALLADAMSDKALAMLIELHVVLEAENFELDRIRAAWYAAVHSSAAPPPAGDHGLLATIASAIYSRSREKRKGEGLRVPGELSTTYKRWKANGR